MPILGLNAYHADASAALLVDGALALAVEEERLSRVKHAAGFPRLAARACLDAAGLAPGALAHVAISRDPRANVARKAMQVALGQAPASLIQTRLENAARVHDPRAALADALGVAPSALGATLHAVEHHRAHLASAFFCSPFDEAAVLSVDGFGDFVSTMWGRGHGAGIEVLGQVGYPHSIGVLYTATTQWLGFPHYGDEGKVMGLAPYGAPRYLDRLRRAVRLTADGFALEPGWFTHTTEGVAMSWDEGAPTLGRLWSRRFLEELGPAREPGAPLTPFHEDVAASLQALTEELVFHVAGIAHRATGADRLCLAGGVALNSVANGKLRANTPFREVYVQPAAGDNGTSLGAALWVEHAVLGRPRRMVLESAAVGPAFGPEACEAALLAEGLLPARPEGPAIERVDDDALLCARVARAIADGLVVGWFQGRMEFGPRALGHRSVLADPRRAEMKDVLNRRIKHREPFRPFAPSVLAERADAWFEDAQPSPAMLMVLPVRPDRRAEVPAITHVDGSGRLQTVAREAEPLYHALIAAFERLSGVPMVLNTSFNENEPIVHTPAEAIACFRRTGMDLLALGPFLVRRPG